MSEIASAIQALAEAMKQQAAIQVEALAWQKKQKMEEDCRSILRDLEVDLKAKADAKENELKDAYEALSRGLVSRHDVSLIENDYCMRHKTDLLNFSWDIPNGNFSEFARVIRPADVEQPSFAVPKNRVPPVFMWHN